MKSLPDVAALPALPVLPLCPVLALTGRPCPTAGTTRALFALMHGDFVGALSYNPVIAVIVVIVARRLLVLTEAIAPQSPLSSRFADRTLFGLFILVASVHYIRGLALRGI